MQPAAGKSTKELRLNCAGRTHGVAANVTSYADDHSNLPQRQTSSDVQHETLQVYSTAKKSRRGAPQEGESEEPVPGPIKPNSASLVQSSGTTQKLAAEDG